MDDIRGTRDICVGAKRKEDPSSSNMGKRQRTSASHEFQDQGQPGPMTCFYCHKPGHIRRDCPQRQGSRGLGMVQSQLVVRQEQLQLVSPYPSMGQRDQYQSGSVTAWYEGATSAPSTSQAGHIG